VPVEKEEEEKVIKNVTQKDIDVTAENTPKNTEDPAEDR
jgi:hypothetical protein